MSDEPETGGEENPALRAELTKKARKANVRVTKEMSITDIEEALVEAALEAPEPETTEITTMAAGSVMCRVTKAGDGKVFTGNGSETYKWNDMVSLPKSVAEDLEKRHFVEIQ